MVKPRNTDAAAEPINTTTPALGERDLHIEIGLDDYVRFEGTAAQLQAEGLVGQDFKWPQATKSLYWEEDGFDYRLHRTQPAGLKGPKESWLGVDNWLIRRTVTGRDRHDIRLLDLERKSAELRVEYHRCTQAGRREWDAAWRRYFDAHNDKDFQAFKALIPGLIPPKRGRKAKTTRSGAAQ